MIRFLIFAVLVGCLSSCADRPGQVFPAAEWERSSPAAQGIDPEVLDHALDYLAGHCKENDLDETLVVRNGYIVWAGDSIERVHDIWSCTKSFTSTAVGMMAEEGLLTLDRPVAGHEHRLDSLYPTATYRHFLTMTSGYNAVGATRWPTDVSEDWSLTPYEPAAPLFPPGTAYAYWDEAMIMFGRALTRAAGTSLNDYLDERLFTPIGIPRRAWWGEGEVDGHPINFGGTGLKMSAAEHARFGWLMLNGGDWDGQQLVPADYVAAATRNQVPTTIAIGDTDRRGTDGRGIYGYNWWVINAGKDSPVDAAFTSGLNHNVCLIVPAWNLVLVRQGTDGNPGISKHEVYAKVITLLAPGID